MSELSLTNNDLHKIIDDAMERGDRQVHIYIMKDNVSISVRPASEDDGMKWRQVGGGYICSDCGGASTTADLYCKHCGAQRTGIIEILDHETPVIPEITLYRKGEEK